jgi:Protein of unknown function (DUF4257)
VLEDIIFSIVIGASVGIVGHVRKHGKLIMPRKTKKFIYLGFFEEMLLCTVAAFLLVMYTAPNSIVENIFISVVAGIGGDVLLTKLKPQNEKSEE